MSNKVGIIVLNWNGKEDTIKCLRQSKNLPIQTLKSFWLTMVQPMARKSILSVTSPSVLSLKQVKIWAMPAEIMSALSML